MDAKRYQSLARTAEPPAPSVRNAVLAFVAGGIICVLAQVVMNAFVSYGFPPEDATAPTAVVMVFFAAVFTAFGLYDRLVKWVGMGASLPITGFANAIVAPAMEFRSEGLVFGTAARMFQVAGPVIAFGMATSFLAGLLLLIGMRVGP